MAWAAENAEENGALVTGSIQMTSTPPGNVLKQDLTSPPTRWFERDRHTVTQLGPWLRPCYPVASKSVFSYTEL